jgi:hypothetical protein
MPRMCKGRQWDSVLIPDNDPSQEIPDGTITIEEEDEPSKRVKGKHVINGSPSDITGTCDHGSPSKSVVHLERREGKESVHYDGHINEGEDDISDGRYRRTGGQIDPDEGTWVATSTGDDFKGGKDKGDEKDKKDKKGEEVPEPRPRSSY